MTIQDFIAWCVERSISFSLIDNDQIKVNAAPGSLTDEVKVQLKARKDEVLAFLKDRSLANSARREPGENQFPLSYSQKRLWAMEHLEQDVSHYNILRALEIQGPCSPNAIVRAFNQLIARHEVLRTRFIEVDGEPVQEPLKSRDIELPQIDLSQLSSDEQEAEVQKYIKQEANYQFDLDNEPLVRLHYLHLSEYKNVLLLNLHHIISDGSSMRLLIKEFMTPYQAIAQGQPLQLPKLPVQYADYAKWQSRRFSSNELQNQLDYWTDKLEGIAPLHSLVLDKPRPVHQSFVAGVHIQQLDQDLFEQLVGLAKAHNVSMFTLLQSAFACLLSRFSGDKDIVMGVPNAGRFNKEVENLIGFFVNVLVLRSDFSDNPGFADVLETARQETIEVLSNQEVPFEFLVDSINPVRDLSYNPIFQIKFLYEPDHSKGIDLGSDIQIKYRMLGEDRTRFDLDLTIYEVDSTLYLSWSYKEDLFLPSSIANMANSMEQLLYHVAKDTQTPLSQIPLCSNDLKQQLLSLSCGKTVAVDGNSINECLHDFTGRYGDNVALVDENTTLTYRQLEDKVNRLANHLLDLGVEQGEPVAIYLERSALLMIAILATMRVGAVYTPLDSVGGRKRIEYIVEDAQIEIMLSSSQLLSGVPLTGVDLVMLDDWQQDDWLVEYAGEAPTLDLDCNDSAYLIYTSGSTGKPKGTDISHGGLLDYCVFARDNYYSDALQGSMVVTSHSFDITVPALFVPLMKGHTVHFLPTEQTLEALAVKMLDSEPMLLRMTPGHVKALLELLSGDYDGHQAYVFVIGGESFDVPLAKRLQARFPNSRIYNHYGPSEAVVGCSMFDVTAGLDQCREYLPIGTPMDNHQLLVVDEKQQLLPRGCVGELCIAGAGVAKGYYKNPELTRTKFVDLEGIAGKGYLTGDKVRWNDRGQLQFLGRIDEQIKLRGYRIEPEEIANVLRQQPGITDACVVLQVHQDTQHLAAYVVGEGSVEKLQDAISRLLPKYMQPSFYMFLEQLPLSPSGKVNRSALPVIESKAKEKLKYVAPTTPTEQILCEVWQQLLGVKRVGIHDNFFALRGDSILAIQAAARSAKRGVHYSTRQLYETPTVAALAKQTSCDAVQTIDQAPVSGKLPLLPVQQRFIEQGAALNHYNQSVLLKVPNTLSITQLRPMLDKIIERHDILRVRFNDANQGLFADDFSLDDCLNETEVVKLDAATIEKLCSDVQTSLNIHDGPLMRMLLVKDAGQARLFWVIHHLLVDGVSWRILLEDLSSLYEQHSNGQALSVGDKTHNLRDWHEHLVQVSNSGALNEQVAFWQQQKVAESIQPRDCQTRKTEWTNRSIQWPAALTEALLTSAGEPLRMQVQEILLSALLLAFKQSANLNELCLTLESHGRNTDDADWDLSQSVGWFTAKYPLKLKTPESNTVDLLKSVKEQLRQVPWDGIGFGILSELTDDSGLEHFAGDVLFNYLGQFDQLSQGHGLFEFTNESTGPSMGADFVPEEAILINALVVEGQLRFDIALDAARVSKVTLKALADSLYNALGEVIDCLGQCKPGKHLTPSDFPQAFVTQAELEKLSDGQTIQDLYPATGLQSGLLYQNALNPGTYVNQVLIEFEGLNPNALRQAWLQLVERHEVLRSNLVLLEEGYHQLVLPAVLDWNQSDLSALDDAAQEHVIETDRLNDKAGHDMDEVSPVMRLRLYRVADTSHKLLWSYHHVLWDGWSSAILIRELLALYQANDEMRSIELPESIGFSHYVKWLSGQDEQAARDYWRESLAQLESISRLPAQASDEQGKTNYHFTLDRELTAQLTELCIQNGCTMNVLFQCAWAYLLFLYTASSKVVFGTVVSGRPAALDQVENMVGLFINTIPVVSHIDPTINWHDWMAQMQHQQVCADEYSYLPLQDIIAGSDFPDLFESLLVFENYPVDEAADSGSENGLQVKGVQRHEGTHYGVTLIVKAGEQLNVEVQVANGHYDMNIMSGVASHFEQILTQLPGCSNEAVCDLPILTPQQLSFLEDVNNTAESLDYEQCMHDLFIEQTQLTPDAVALVDDEGELTYIQLFALVSALHQHLLTHNIQLQEPVIVRMPKGRWQLIAATAIMMAGGAYLPLEISWPRERCTKVIRKSGCHLALVIDDKDAPEDIAHVNVANLSLQCADPLAAAQDFVSVQKPSDLAYIIFTSGSTGEPKGVAIEHRSAVNTLLDINNKYGITAADRVLAVSALSFDLSVYDLFGLLACGGSIIFPSHDRAMEPAHWASLIEQHQVTLWDTVPASVELLVEQFDFLGRPSTAPIRNVLMSGDWIDPALPKRIWNTFEGANAVSMGGATEGSIWSIFYRITQDTSGWKSVPYGKPLANQSFHILNENLQQVPPGVVAELFIGGVGVAREYYGDPDLSAYRYIHHPGLGQRLYRTGDMGRYMSDGNIEFMGRVDDQVKINGFRIETGEIEQQLSALEGVYACLVTVNKLESGINTLVAYVQLNKDSKFYESNLDEQFRKALSANLPAYMIPQFFVSIEKWPLTANGKVDKKYLPKPNISSLLTAYEAPTTESEQQMTEIWAQLLNVDVQVVGVNTSFMELGGNSLLVIRMAARVEQQMGAKLELRQVYEHLTIRRLCELLDINRKQQSIAEQLYDMDDFGIEEISL